MNENITPEGAGIEGLWKEAMSIAEELAGDSSRLRENASAIAEKVASVGRKSGVVFGDTEEGWWEREGYKGFTYRIALQKRKGEWVMGVQRTEATPLQLGGTGWIGWPDPFCEEAGPEFYEVRAMGRPTVVKFVENLPGFLERYVEDLRRRHARVREVRRIAERIRAVLQ